MRITDLVRECLGDVDEWTVTDRIDDDIAITYFSDGTTIVTMGDREFDVNEDGFLEL